MSTVISLTSERIAQGVAPHSPGRDLTASRLSPTEHKRKREHAKRMLAFLGRKSGRVDA